MEDIIIEYDNIKKNMIINHFDNTIVSEDNNEGIFKLESDVMNIKWNNSIEESFKYVEKKNNINYYIFMDNLYDKIYIVNGNNEEIYLINSEKFIKKNGVIIGTYIINNDFLTIKDINLIEYKYILVNNKYYLRNLYEIELNLYYYDNKIINNKFYINNHNKNIYNTEDSYNNCGNFILINNILNVYWNNNVQDIFIINDNKKFYYSEYLLNNIFQKILVNIQNSICTYLLNNDNMDIFNEDNNQIIYKYTNLDNNKIGINDNIYELDNNNIYQDVTHHYIKTIEIIHNDWNDKCSINSLNNYLCRLSVDDEDGTYKLYDNIIIIYWTKWDSEIFVKNNDVYFYKEKYNFNIDVLPVTNIDKIEFSLIHPDWNDICVVDNNSLYRKNDENELGKYILESNKLTIEWDKWDTNIFYKCGTEYYLDTFINFIIINNIKYIINNYNNKIYDYNDISSNNSDIGSFYLDNTYINIIIDNISNIYYYKSEQDNIVLYNDIFKEIIIHKYFDETYTLNLLTEEITDKHDLKIGYFKFTENNQLLSNICMKSNIYDVNKENLNIVFENNLFKTEEYKLYNGKYYYQEYLILHDKKIYLINLDTNNSYYYINYIDNYLYNNDEKIKYLQNNNIYYIIKNDKLYKYYLLKIKYISDEFNIFLIDNLYNYIDETNDSNINLNIYKEFNKELANLSTIELIYHLFKYGIPQNKIYSMKSFLRRYTFFSIDNNIDDIEDIIINMYNNIGNIYIDINDNIDLVYDNLFNEIDDIDIYETDDIDNIYDTDSTQKYLFNDNNFNIIYDFNNTFYEETIFIINLENFNEINQLLEIIPKKSNLILNINSVNIINVNIFNIIKNYSNLIITKSKYIDNVSYLEYIINMLNEQNKFKKIFYINRNTNLIENNNINIYKIKFEENILKHILNESKTIYDIILILIFSYIIQREVYNILKSNFYNDIQVIKDIINNNYSNNIMVLQ